MALSQQQKKDNDVISGFLSGSRSAPSTAPGLTAPAASVAGAAPPLAPTSALPAAAPVNRPKPAPIETTLTPRTLAGGLNATRDNAVINSLLGQSGGAASLPAAQQSRDSAVISAVMGQSASAVPTAPPQAPVAAQGTTIQQSRDTAVLSSLMGQPPVQSSVQVPTSNPGLSAQDQRDKAIIGALTSGQPNTLVQPPPQSGQGTNLQERRDDAVIGSLVGQGGTGQERRDGAVIDALMVGQAGSVQGGYSQERRDNAVIDTMMAGHPTAPAWQGGQSALVQNRRDDAVISALFGQAGVAGSLKDGEGLGAFLGNAGGGLPSYRTDQERRDDACVARLVAESFQGALPYGAEDQIRSDDEAIAFLMGKDTPEAAKQSSNRPGGLRRRTGGTASQNVAASKRLGQRHGKGHADGLPRRTRVGPKQGPHRDILEERTKPILEHENISLRKTKMEMKCKVQKLEAELRRLKDQSAHQGGETEFDAMMEVESLQKAMNMGGQRPQRPASTGWHRGQRSPAALVGQPRQRQNSQRRLGGRLQRRVGQPSWDLQEEVLPPSPKASSWGRPAQPLQIASAPWFEPPKLPSPTQAGYQPPPWLEPPRLSSPTQVGPPAPIYPTSPVQLPEPARLMPAHVPPLPPPQELPPFVFPDAGKPLTWPSSPTAALPSFLPEPNKFDSVGEPVQDEYGRKLMEEESALREQKRSLDKELEDLLVKKIKGDKETQKYKERSKLKDARIQNLEKELQREKFKTVQSREELVKAHHDISKEVAVSKDRVEQQALLGGGHNVLPLQEKLQKLKTENKLKTKEIRDMTVGAFCDASGQRVVTKQKEDELMSMLRKKEEDIAKITADLQRIDDEKTKAMCEVAVADETCTKLMEENERLTIRMEAKQEAVQRAQDAWKGILDNLDPEDRNVLNFSLQFLKRREDEKRNQQLLDRVVQGSTAPGPSDLITASVAAGIRQGSVEETTHIVEELREEKAELAQEVVAIKAIIEREKAIIKEMKAMHDLDVDELGLQIQASMEDMERCKRLATDREARIKEYRKELAKREKLAAEQPGRPRPPGARIEKASDVVSEAGFSGLTELEGNTNALDIYLTTGRIEERAILELPRAGDEVPPESSFVTMIFVEFLHFDVACSEESSSLRPRFDSLISFGPFETEDPVIEHFAKGSVSFEMQAFAIGGTAAFTLGRASLPLAVLLDCTPQDKNPVVTGTLSFASALPESDGRLQIASVQFKARWRNSVLDALNLYAARRGASPTAMVQAQTAKIGPGALAAAELMGSVRTLLVQIRAVTGLHRPNVPAEALRPYVSYEIPGHRSHSTETMVGSVCAFKDTGKISIRIDEDFCRWANRSPQEGGGLQFLVFDSTVAPQVGAQAQSEESLGVLGETCIPIGTLLTSAYAQVEGAYPLQRKGEAAGVIDLHIRWQEPPSVIVAQPGAGATMQTFGMGSSTAFTEEKYQITWHRVMRRLNALRLSANEWFNRHDLDKDGCWTKLEARMALSQLPVGLSPYECEQIFDRMDMRRCGLVTLSDLAAALAEGAKAAPLEQWARDVYRRMHEAMARQGQTAEQAFCAVARGWQAQKREFFALVTSLDLCLKPEQLEWLWKLSDANSDGLLNFREFALRLKEVTGMATTAYTLPRPDLDTMDVPGIASGPVWEQSPVSDTRLELCLLRLLLSCLQMGWRTIDRIMQEMGTREDGTVSRAVLITFSSRARARLSDWEIDQLVSRLDFDGRGVIDARTLRTAILRCEISDAPCQVVMRRAAENIGRIRQALMDRRLRTAPQVSTVVGIGGASTAAEDLQVLFRTLLEEVVAQKAPLIVTRPEFLKVAQLLGVDRGQTELDEVWAAVGKMRDSSLDIAEFVKQVSETPLPGEGAYDSMTDERFAILMGRIKNKLEELQVGSLAKAFDRFRTGTDGCLSPAELEAALTQILDNLSPHERRLLVARIDANKDGRISLVEMEAALSHASVSALGQWAADICGRIAGTLRKKGKSVHDLFDSLAESGLEVHFPNFEKLFAQMEPSLTTRQLQQLWWAFDKNKDGGVSRDEFCRAFVIIEEGEAPPPEDMTPNMTDLLLSRIHRALGVGPLSIATALTVFDVDAEGSLDWPQWRNACRSLRLPLAEAEANALHCALSRAATRNRMSLSVLDAEVARVAMRILPEERWAQTFVSGCAARAVEAGAPSLHAVLAASGEDAVEEAVLLAALGRHHPVAEAQWLRLRPLLERHPHDGRVLWQAFLRWASVPVPEAGIPMPAPDQNIPLASPIQASAHPPVRSSEDTVLSRVQTALRQAGKSADDLFLALAKDGMTMQWDNFLALFTELEPTLTGQQLEQLWRSFDKDGDGGITLTEFKERLGLFAKQTENVTSAHTPELSVLARVQNALGQAGKSVDELFVVLAKGSGSVQWADFLTFFIDIEPSLTGQQLQQLWRSFDKDGDGGVTRTEFIQILDPRQAQHVAPAAKESVLSRLQSALSQAGKSVDQLFIVLTKDGASVKWPEFVGFFTALESSLTEQQLHELWRGFDQDGDGGVTRTEFKQVLDPNVAVEESVVSRMQNALSQAGKSVDELFGVLAKDGTAVAWDDFWALFTKMEPSLTEQQLRKLWESFDKDGDGSVSRNEFAMMLAPSATSEEPAPPLPPPAEPPEQTLPVTTGEKVAEAISVPIVHQPAAAGAGALEDSIVSRVLKVLADKGKSVDELFDALAKDSPALRFDDFWPLMIQLEPNLSFSQLQHLWGRFDKDGDGAVSRSEFLRILQHQAPSMPPPAEPPAQTLPQRSPLSDNGKSLLRAIADVSADRAGTAIEQLQAFDTHKTGRLDRPGFGNAMRWYSPGVTNDVLMEVWSVLSGPEADSIGIDELAKKLTGFLPVSGTAEATGTPAAAPHSQRGAGVGPLEDVTPPSRVASCGPGPCPVDFSGIATQRLSDITDHFHRNGPDGYIPFDTLHRILETNGGIQLPPRMQSRLRKWLGEPHANTYYWPPMLAFTINIDSLTIVADQRTRKAYPSLQLEVSFCGEAVRFEPFPWSVGMMPGEPKKMTRSQRYHARFNIDGPECLRRENVQDALRFQAPPSQPITISLIASETPFHASAEAIFTYNLGSIQLIIPRDIPRERDLQQGAKGTVKKIEWYLPIPGSGPGRSTGPHLTADVAFSTVNARRIWQM